MAGGFGTRLRPLTHNCPKPLLKVGEKPILEIILERFIGAGFHRFFISTHYMPEMIREHFGDGSRWGVSIRYVHEETPLGTGGALGLLPHHEIDSPLFLMNGDLLTTLNFLNLLEFHTAHGGVATMCVREYEYHVPYGVVQSDGHRISSMVEKPVQKFFINAGIYLLSPGLVKSVKAGTRIDMPTLLEQEIERQQAVNMFPVHEYWLDIGRMEDFVRAQQEFASL
ncbi:phospho-sugar nucleotidyltransferase [Pseudomonas aeruginosa PA38182]|nr:phospho-sugar nucleotidyltransferase [Pseudomonas aeruginosa PA38182]